MQRLTLYAIIAAIVVSVASAAFLAVSTDEPTTETTTLDVVNVGVMLPATGDLASHGIDNKIAVELALDDFNAYLDSQQINWNMNLIIEDTQTDPILALEKIQSLNSKGIKFILGTETSAELRNVKSYADSNNIIMISPSSTSPKLAIDDNIFRFVPDDTKQGKVIAQLLKHHDIEVVVPVYRGDVWGDGLYESSRNSFESIGGTVDEGIRYSPEVTVFSTEAKLLSDTISQYRENDPTKDVAVLMIGFSEVVHFFNSASSYDSLKDVQWFGSDASSNDDFITQDRIASEFAQDTNFITTQFSASDNEKYQHVKRHIAEVTGSGPNSYAYSSYDSLWVLGLSIIEAGSVEYDDILSALPIVASEYTGAIGQIQLNEYGDLAISDYELWRIHDGAWELFGRYLASSGEIVVY